MRRRQPVFKGKKQRIIFSAMGVYACGYRQLFVSLHRIDSRSTWPNNLPSFFMNWHSQKYETLFKKQQLIANILF
jgi:hypothetical protein